MYTLFFKRMSYRRLVVGNPKTLRSSNILKADEDILEHTPELVNIVLISQGHFYHRKSYYVQV